MQVPCNNSAPYRRSDSQAAHPRRAISRKPPCDQGESGRRYAPEYSPTHRPPTRGQQRGHQAGAGPRGHPGGGESSGRSWGPSSQSGEPHAPALRALCCTPSFLSGFSPGHPHLSPFSPRQPPHPLLIPACSPRTPALSPPRQPPHPRFIPACSPRTHLPGARSPTRQGGRSSVNITNVINLIHKRN